MIEMIEPTDPVERAVAIRICRANAHLHPETGKPDHKAAARYWAKGPELPYKKWIWMWNYGQVEWDPRASSNSP